MTDEPEVTSFDVEVEKAWTAFRDTLANRLEQFGDDENVILELDAPTRTVGRRPRPGRGLRGRGPSGRGVLECLPAPEHRLSSEQEELLEDAGFAIDRDDAGEPEATSSS